MKILYLISIFTIGILLNSNLRAYSATDVLAFKRISQVVPSDNGNKIAFVSYQVKFNKDGKKWEYSLYVKEADKPIKLLDQSDEISAVNWSPNNKIIGYLAKGQHFQSIWTYDIEHNKKQKLLEFTNDIIAFKWSPNGKMIAFTADQTKTNPNALMPIDVAQDYVNTRLYIFDLDKRQTQVLTPDEFSLSQFFVYPGFDWAPDSNTIAFSYQPQPGDAYSLKNKIGIINLITKKMINLPYSEKYNSTQPAYSLDGKYIAFQANSQSDIEPKNIYYDKFSKLSPTLLLQSKINRICVSETTSFKTHCLADTYNQNPIMIGWNQSSDKILAFDPYYKTEGPRIYALSLNSNVAPSVLSNVSGFIEPLTLSLNNSHTLLGLGYETVSDAPEAFIASTESFQLKKITDFSKTNKKLGAVKVIKWPSAKGLSIEGLLITPANYDAKKTYPLFVNVHGGPAAAWSKRYLGGCDEYETMIDPTTCYANLLDLGYVIFQPNPRGSDGYGAEFRLANFVDFGGGDYEDILNGIDYLIKQGIVDEKHISIGGWSYGGYLTAWSISQTNRFESAIDGDGNTNWISYAGTSSQPLFISSYFGGAFWDDAKLYLQRSVIMRVKNINTPLLIMHGEKDLGQVPITQSKELYTDLSEQHKTVKMLILPEQGHVPRDANIIYACINNIDNWLKKFFKQTNKEVKK